MKYLLNKKGFTLIELLIVLAISGIVITVVGSFFISNYKLFFKADDQITVQHQSQNAMTKVIDKIRETEGVLQSPTSSAAEYTIKFKKDLTIKYDKSNKIITYKIGTQSEVQLAQAIEDFEVSPIPRTSNYTDCRGVEIKIKTSKNESEVEIHDEVYFRNK